MVFDCDGVLVDSEILVVEVEAEVLTEAGFPITTAEVIDRYVGLSHGLMVEALEADFNKPVPPDLQERLERAALARLETSVRPVTGIEGILSTLAADERARCVASSSDLNRVRMSLRVAGLDGWFDPELVFSAQMVARPKPAPDVFLLAAERAGFEPGACLVVEDSAHGVTAAVAAGMEVVGLTAGGHARPGLEDRLLQAGASCVVATADALHPVLGIA